MKESRKAILDVLNGKQAERVPIWLMRQAGRYLPEYRELRSKAGGFLQLCLTPHWAAEITLQPIRRFDLDAAILFADILLIPYALGLKLEFREGEGPVLETVKDEDDLDRLHYDETMLLPVFEAIKLVKKDLPSKTALICFCGSLWTVACYMIDGNSKDNFTHAKLWAKEKPEQLQMLIDILSDASFSYLSGQIDAGAEVIQLFESWAGLLEDDLFDQWIIEPTRKFVARLKEKYPHIPIIGFPREARKKYHDYILKTGVDCVGLDQWVDLDYAKNELQTVKPVQGIFYPVLLLKGGGDMKNAAKKILNTLGPGFIFNLGHGVTPDVPPEHVAELVKIVRNWKKT